MSYRPKPGGYRWKQTVGAARADLQLQRRSLLAIVNGGLTAAELYQHTTAIALLNAAIDDRLGELLDYREDTDDA